MKRKKIISTILWTVGSTIILTCYFWGLSYFGQHYRETHKEKNSSEKKDTSLVEGWKFHLGDNPNWAFSDFNDSAWKTVRLDSMRSWYSGQLAWFRLQLKVDSAFLNKPIALVMEHWGASEIYLDGEKIANFGTVAAEKSQEKNIDPGTLPVNVQLHHTAAHVIAVRYSYQHFPDCKKGYGSAYYQYHPEFELRIQDNKSSLHDVLFFRNAMIGGLAIGVFLITLSFVHFLLYLFYRKAKENLLYSVFAFCYAMLFIFSDNQAQVSTKPSAELFYSAAINLFLNPLLPLSVLLFVLQVFESRFSKWLWACVVIAVSISVLDFFTDWINSSVAFTAVVWLTICTMITMIVSTYKAIRKKIPGAKILGVGISVFALLIFIILSVVFFNNGNATINPSNIAERIIAVAALLSIPLSMSIYLAYSFSHTNRSLQNKLIEVEDLSAKTISQEKEKQEILSQQKEKLEIQVAERTKEISEQKKVIEEQKQIVEEKNKDITDSIIYAKRIQQAKLPKQEEIKFTFPQSFILFKPKDIVSGDFYYFTKNHHGIFIAAADCTGHGVPGAFMSIIGSEKLDDAVSQSADTSEILKQLNKGIKTSLRQSGSDESTRDGMDIAICRVDLENRIVKYAGANRPLWLIRKGCTEVEEIKATKTAIGGLTEDTQHFETHEIKLQQGDTFYIFSDGYADTFSGQNGKKLMTKNFKEILLGIQDKTMQEQEKHLDVFIENWKAGTEQVDDILVIGVRL